MDRSYTAGGYYCSVLNFKMAGVMTPEAPFLYTELLWYPWELLYSTLSMFVFRIWFAMLLLLWLPLLSVELSVPAVEILWLVFRMSFVQNVGNFYYFIFLSFTMSGTQIKKEKNNRRDLKMKAVKASMHDKYVGWINFTRYAPKSSYAMIPLWHWPPRSLMMESAWITQQNGMTLRTKCATNRLLRKAE